jgi:hypothetical protein
MTRRPAGPAARCAAALALTLLTTPLAQAQPAPPDLRQLPAPAAVPPPDAASAPPAPKRRCVAGCDGEVTRLRVTEDALNLVEETLNNRGDVVKVVVKPKSGAPAYEILVGPDRQRATDAAHRSGYVAEPQGVRREGQAVWPLVRF